MGDIIGAEEEAALLGAILNQGSAYQEAAVVIKEEDIYGESHRLIWRAMTALNNKGKKIDPISVCTILREKRCLTRAGGTSAVSALVDTLADVSNVKYYAEQVNSAARGRDLKRTGRKMMNDDTPPYRRLDIAFIDIAEINARAAYGKRVSVGDVSSKIMSTLIDGNGFTGGVKTGFYNLDVPLNGLKPQDYIILGARPSIGKSALALQIAANVAKKNCKVLYISPEMSQQQLVFRLLSMESGVPYEKIVKGEELKEDEKDALCYANDTIKLLPITIDDSSEQSVVDVRLKSRQCAVGSGLDLLIIDYLQLLCPEDDDKASVTKVSKGLKAIAKDLEIPVLVCSQLRRRYGQEPRRPDSARLRGSGQIEQDADAILLMYRPDRDNKTKIEVFISKHRNGPLGQTMLEFDLETTKFVEREVW